MATSRDVSEAKSSEHGEVASSTGGRLVEITQLPGNIYLPPSVLQGNSEATVHKDHADYVPVPEFWEAWDALRDTGCVVLSGPPGSGKTTLANNLARHCQQQGFAVYTLEGLERLRSHVGERERSVVVLDGTLGRVRVNSQQHACWKLIVGTVKVLLQEGRCRLVVTVYPHVLRELQQLQNDPLSPLTTVVCLTDPLPVEVRKEFLHFYLDKLPSAFQVDDRDELIATVLRNDTSGPAFPWCCDHMVKYWDLSDDSIAIFRTPAEAYSELLKDMVLDDAYGSGFAAVLALTMKGVCNFLLHLSETKRHLKELGFDGLSPDTVARYQDLLVESMLQLSDGSFSCRAFYEAAGLALGRFFRLATLLKVCDMAFLVRYVHFKVTHTEGRPCEVCVLMGSPSIITCFIHKSLRAGDREALVHKIYREIVEGNLRDICQHPSLRCLQFLQELDKYCSGDSHRMERLLNAVDHEHQLPLLYWSSFHPSPYLTQWCLSRIQSSKRLSARALLACSLFDHLAHNSRCQLQPLLHTTLTSQFFQHPECVMEFPLIGQVQCLSDEIQSHMEAIARPDAAQGRLLYLLDPSLPILPDVVTVLVTPDKVYLQVQDTGHWYLVFRLLTDREGSETDRDGNSLLHTAVISGHSAAITLSLQAGAMVAQQNRQGLSPYQLGQTSRSLASKRRKEFVNFVDEVFGFFPGIDKVQSQLLLLQKIGVNNKDSRGRTGLLVACREGRGDIADMYIELGVDVGVKDSVPYDEDHVSHKHCTPLHYACRNGMVHTAELLIGRRADVTSATKGGFSTPLHFACRCSSHSASVDITRLLLQAGAVVDRRNKCGRTPLHCAASEGQSDTADLLIRHKADIGARGQYGDTPLHCAAGEGQSHTADLLIRLKADVNAQDEHGNTPLHFAASKGHSDTADLLIRHKADISAHGQYGYTPLHCAAGEGHSDTADLLIRHKADIGAHGQYGYTPLHCAAGEGHSDTADLLIRHKADVGARGQYGDTPLHCAASKGHSDTADLLIRHKADVNAQDDHGNAPLHCAAGEGQLHTADLLIHHEADINAQDEHGNTPLHCAANKGCSRTADLLILHKADVNAKGEHGDTPLHFAANKGHDYTAYRLVCKGAELDSQNKKGRRPFSHIRRLLFPGFCFMFFLVEIARAKPAIAGDPGEEKKERERESEAEEEEEEWKL